MLYLNLHMGILILYTELLMINTKHESITNSELIQLVLWTLIEVNTSILVHLVSFVNAALQFTVNPS